MLSSDSGMCICGFWGGGRDVCIVNEIMKWRGRGMVRFVRSAQKLWNFRDGVAVMKSGGLLVSGNT